MPDQNTNSSDSTNKEAGAQVSAADARTYLADFVTDANTLTGMKDEDVLAFHKKVGEGVTKHAPKYEPPKAPEKYDFKFSDGVELDPAALKVFSPILQKYGISQEAAQELATAWVAELSRQDGVINELYTGQTSSWEAASKADKEFGGANFDANMAVARKGLARFGSPELKALLDDSGLGNHPEVIRFMWKIGKGFKEDSTIVTGNGAAKDDVDRAKRLFDHPTSQNFT